jgi:hypothetical protein
LILARGAFSTVYVGVVSRVCPVLGNFCPPVDYQRIAAVVEVIGVTLNVALFPKTIEFCQLLWNLISGI